VLGNRSIGTGIVRKCSAHSCAEHRVGERPGVEQEIGSDVFGELERRDERDVGNTTSLSDSERVGADQPPNRETDEVARHDDRDGSERIVLLSSCDVGNERFAGLTPVVDELGRFDHVDDSTEGVPRSRGDDR